MPVTFYKLTRSWQGWMALATCLSCLLTFTAHAAPPPLQPGDTVVVTIPEERLRELTAVVDPTGGIDLGVYGRVVIAGLNPAQAERQVRLSVGRLLRDTRAVGLRIAARGRMVHLSGHVAKPGLSVLSHGMGLWHALNEAGGVTPGGDLSRILLIRGDEEKSIDLEAWLGLVGAPPPPLLPGDKLFIPSRPGWTNAGEGTTRFTRSAADAFVFVAGAVRNPGHYPRTVGLSVVEALMLARGPLADANLSAVRLVTARGTKSLDVTARLLKAGCGPNVNGDVGTSRCTGAAGANAEPHTIPLKGTAIIFVPQKRPSSAHDDPFGSYVQVLGGVGKPGLVGISKPVRLDRAIALAGGATDTADLESVVVTRAGAGHTITSTIDLQNFFDEGGALPPMVGPGDRISVPVQDLDVPDWFIRFLSQTAVVATSLVLLFTL